MRGKKWLIILAVASAVILIIIALFTVFQGDDLQVNPNANTTTNTYQNDFEDPEFVLP